MQKQANQINQGEQEQNLSRKVVQEEKSPQHKDMTIMHFSVAS
jgi:hypothetical protein